MKTAVTLLPVLVTFLAACSKPSQPAYEIKRAHKYEVSVYSGGKEVKDFNSALVQRISLSPKLVSEIGSGKSLPADGVSELDREGRVTGVRIVASKRGGNPALIGLREKDLVTAVGMKPMRRIEDLRALALDLEREKASSLTLERNGKPHKILYFISRS